MSNAAQCVAFPIKLRTELMRSAVRAVEVDSLLGARRAVLGDRKVQNVSSYGRKRPIDGQR